MYFHGRVTQDLQNLYLHILKPITLVEYLLDNYVNLAECSDSRSNVFSLNVSLFSSLPYS